MTYVEECRYIFIEGQKLLPHDFGEFLEPQEKKNYVGLVYNCPDKEYYDESSSPDYAIQGPAYSELFVIYLILYSNSGNFYYAAYPTERYALLKKLEE